MSTAGKGIRKKKPVPAKTSLNNPYTLQWSPLGGEDMHFVLQVLQEKFKKLGLQKKEEARKIRKWRKKKPKPSTETPVTEPPPKAEGEIAGPPDFKTQGWTDPALRQQLAIGINEVTRALERNELCLVLVCKSAKPNHMTNHLIPLSETRAVPACQVPRLSENIASLLGLKCILALGFKRNSETFGDEVRAITPKVPPFQVSWIPARAETKAAAEQSASGECAESEPATSRKRKVDACSPEVEEQLGTTTLASLQPLKIRKVIPNPNKTRKPKRKTSQKLKG